MELANLQQMSWNQLRDELAAAEKKLTGLRRKISESLALEAYFEEHIEQVKALKDAKDKRSQEL